MKKRCELHPAEDGGRWQMTEDKAMPAHPPPPAAPPRWPLMADSGSGKDPQGWKEQSLMGYPQQ